MRAEHIAWCKERALAYLPDEPEQALASMLSDLSKHAETASTAMAELTMMLMVGGLLGDADAVRRHIEGFR